MNDERGQILPLVAGLVVVCGIAAVGLGRLGERALDRARAQSAADASALAGAVGGEAEGRRAAEDNGATVVSYRNDGPMVGVEVALGTARARASARAVSGGGRGGGGGGGDPPAVAPGLGAVLARAADLLGRPVPVTRVLDQGLQVEVPPDAVPRLLTMTEEAGICRPDPSAAPALFGICPPPATALTGVPEGE